jgi:hypothetical protein
MFRTSDFLWFAIFNHLGLKFPLNLFVFGSVRFRASFSQPALTNYQAVYTFECVQNICMEQEKRVGVL